MRKAFSLPVVLTILLVISVLVFSSPSPVLAAGAATFTGRVMDSAGVPIRGATVTVSGCNGGSTTTDASGAYTLPVSWDTPDNKATCSLTASASGYMDQTQDRVINDGGTRTANFSLIESTTPPPPPPPPPAITVTISFKPDGNDGWFKTNPAIGTVTATNQLSPIASLTCSGSSVTLSDISPLPAATVTGTLTAVGEGVHTIICNAIDSTGTYFGSDTFKVMIDTLAPTSINVSADRTPDAGGYYNHDFTATWNGTDATSGIASCTSETYSSPDTNFGSMSGNCTDKAGNSSISVAFYFKFDATAPAVSGTPDRLPDSNGWYTHPVDIIFSGTDVTSGILICDIISYLGPDGLNVTISGTCTDKAGNTSTLTPSLPFDYDDSGPIVTITPDRPPNLSGWFNAPVLFTFSGEDGSGSGTISCPEPITYSGPDGSTLHISGTCTDNAGNISLLTTFAFSYDTVNPAATAHISPAANSFGWHNTDVTVTFNGTDTLSGIDICDDPVILTIEGSGQSASGTCTDKAGNVSPLVVANDINIDKTSPTVSGAPNRPPDYNGWYNYPVDIIFSGRDAMSGILICDFFPYYGPDGSDVTASGTCIDKAGNTSLPTSSTPFNYDGSAPLVTVTPDRAPNANGWYNAPVLFTFSGDDGAGSGIASCLVPITYSGPDGSTLTIEGSCTDNAGNVRSVTFPFSYDTEKPTASASLSPEANPDGWHNTDVTVVFSGSDTLSGIDFCNVPVLLTTEGRNLSANGSCTDKAGNISLPARISNIKIDKTDPRIFFISHLPAPDFSGWNSTPVVITWGCVDYLSGEIAPRVETTIDSEGAGQSATGVCTDRAGNTKANVVKDINIAFYQSQTSSPNTVVSTPPASITQNPILTTVLNLLTPGEPQTGGKGRTGTNRQVLITLGEEGPINNLSVFIYLLLGIGGSGFVGWLALFLLNKRKRDKTDF